MVFGNRWASVSQTSTDVQGAMLRYNPPLIYTRDCTGTGLTKNAQEPALMCKVIKHVPFIGRDVEILEQSQKDVSYDTQTCLPPSRTGVMGVLGAGGRS